ncbi:hypothetical protein ALI144C_23590 [Actinosynnema sp. ALI-1.44]|uniref:DUF3558 domain-containing protein n=1 Tax=Actinosynnema sp. ALI-1.44 TaxID=1933779 RepID=UPI00097BFBDE|nr:DUF3558 domain-containing protein [Actinosynnema sp. ALI-1.44]ONI79739.1 hypothetical protein ALI144C_23590 [Actinosynnema sp. ALI-1.44]
MRRLAALALLPLTLTIACDNSTTTTPPTTTSTTTPRTTPNSPQAPRVPTPLDAVAFTTDPCRSLTDNQRQRLGVDKGEVTEIAREGVSCFYRYPGGTPSAVSVTYATKDQAGLNSRYNQHAAGFFNYWAPDTVDGHPALGYGASDSADPNPRTCNFAIALTDTLYFWVTADDTPGAAKCSATKEVASAVLATIKATR